MSFFDKGEEYKKEETSRRNSKRNHRNANYMKIVRTVGEKTTIFDEFFIRNGEQDGFIEMIIIIIIIVIIIQVIKIMKMIMITMKKKTIRAKKKCMI